MDKLIKYLSAKSPRELVILVLIIVISLWLLSKFVFPKLKGIVAQITPAKIEDGSSIQAISPDRDAFLDLLAKELFDAYSCWFCSSSKTTESINKALGLNDSELIILNRKYHKLGDNTLYYDTDWEFLPNTQADDQLMARLEQLNISMK